MDSIAIIGAGKLGLAMAKGWVKAGLFSPAQVRLYRRNQDALAPLAQEGYVVCGSVEEALASASVAVLAVLPQQLADLLKLPVNKDGFRSALAEFEGLFISTVTGVNLERLNRLLPHKGRWLRAMPNTAVSVRQSMTCLAGPKDMLQTDKLTMEGLFEALGRYLWIAEEQMQAATALCACGIAFFLRAIRAASQGGIQIGFHAEEALLMAVQTSLGAASLLQEGQHPEEEIDRVTSPKGCTILGLNQMEYHGFSAALIRGIVTSADKAGELFKGG